MRNLLILIILSSFSLTSCCTIAKDSHQNINVSSYPPGANVTIDGVGMGKTPLKAKLEKKYSHEVLVEKEGFYSENYVLKSKNSASHLASNLMIPAGLGMVGLGAGLALTGGSTAGLSCVLVASAVLIGLSIGAVGGVVGTATDLHTRRACQIYPKKIHAQLIPVQIQ